MILIITGRRDSHIDSVSRHLDAAGAPWVRANTEDFATNAVVTVDPGAGVGRITFKDSGRSLDLGDVSAVWYRKPEPVGLSHFSLEPAALEYIEAEFTEVLHGLYGLLNNVFWLNNPFSTRLAHRKLAQLRVASQVGFVTPRTLVTNASDTALEFAQQLGGTVAIKSLGSISVAEEGDEGTRQYGIFTRRLAESELLDHRDKIGYMPTLFQEFVEKQHELRVTCVGSRVFACRIEPRDNDLTSDDYRFDTANLRHSAAEVPELHASMHAYMRKFGLEFGCFDFAVAADGPVFLECNPNGQWRWVEDLTGLQIGAAIAEVLIRAQQQAGVAA